MDITTDPLVAMTYRELLEVYGGSNGDVTKALYRRLEAIGPTGRVAMNLFRAQKCSERAKVYRGGVRGRGSYRDMAYERKEYSLAQLCGILTAHGAALSLTWGWQRDPEQARHHWVLYVDLPTGQVSFHTGARGTGPDYPGRWDGIPGQSAIRILRFCEHVFAAARRTATVLPFEPRTHEEGTTDVQV